MNRTQRRQLEREQGKKIKADKPLVCSKNEMVAAMDKAFQERKVEFEEKYKEREREIKNCITLAFIDMMHSHLEFGAKRIDRALKIVARMIDAMRDGDIDVNEIYKDLEDKNIPVMRFEKGDE